MIFLIFIKDKMEKKILQVFSDVDYIDNKFTRRSILE